MSQHLNLSPSPCLRWVRNLEKAGILKGNVVVVDARPYGLSQTTFVRVRLERHSGEAVTAFEQGTKRIHAMIDCHVIAGGTDNLLRAPVTNLQSYERFIRNRLHRIKGIASIDTGFAYRIAKQSSAFPAIPRQRPETRKRLERRTPRV